MCCVKDIVCDEVAQFQGSRQLSLVRLTKKFMSSIPNLEEWLDLISVAQHIQIMSILLLLFVNALAIDT